MPIPTPQILSRGFIVARVKDEVTKTVLRNLGTKTVIIVINVSPFLDQESILGADVLYLLDNVS